MNRRQFAGRLAALWACVGGLSGVSSACRASSGEKGGGATTAGPLEDELRIYNWSDYVADNTVPDFEKEFGVRVSYDTYESNEELLAKLEAGATGYDLIVPTGYLMPALLAQDLIAPINRALIPNLVNVAQLFSNPPFDPGGMHSVPWQWGTAGIAYRKDLVSPVPTSWGVFLDPRWHGRMTQLDDERDVIGAWLRYRGHSLNETDPVILRQAQTDAVAAKQNLKAYLSAPVKGQLVSGDVWIAQLWSGDAAQARSEQPMIGFVLPREGTTIFLDSLVIPRAAPHKRAAHAFMDYSLRPAVAAAIADATGYGTPNQAAMPLMKHPVPYPTSAELARLEYQRDLGPAAAEWDRLWTEIKSS